MFLDQINRKLERQRAAREASKLEWLRTMVTGARTQVDALREQPKRTVGVHLAESLHPELEVLQKQLGLSSKSKAAEVVLAVGLRCTRQALSDSETVDDESQKKESGSEA